MVHGYPVVGRAMDILPINGNFFSHEKILNYIKNYGPIVQTFTFDRNVIFISDGKVLKQAMDSIKDKGSVHVSLSIPYLFISFIHSYATCQSTYHQRAVFAAKNIFCLPTDQEWKRRRQSFRHAFTSTTLQSVEQNMLKLVDKLRIQIDSYAENQSILLLDELFGQFTLDTLYEFGFEYNKDFMNHSDAYKVSLSVSETEVSL